MKRFYILLIALILCFPYKVEAATKINASSATLLVRSTKNLKITGTNKKVSWSSDNSSIASVDKNGNVRAVSPGIAKIVAKVGNSKYTCKVTVKTDIYKTITLNFNDLESWKKSVRNEELALTFGGEESLPELDNSTYYTGNIIRSRTILKYKTVNVKVSQNTPGYYKTVKLDLPKKIKYQLHRHSKNIVGGAEGFGILIGGLVQGTISWKTRCSCGLSSDISWEIPVDSDLISAASGTSVNSKDIVSYQPTYDPVYSPNVIEASIQLNKSSATIYTSGKNTVKLEAITEGTTQQVTWSSSNEKIAAVDSTGLVTAKKTGTVTISAKANGIMAQCKITVKKPIDYKSKYTKYLKTHLKKQYYAIANVGENRMPVLIVVPKKSSKMAKDSIKEGYRWGYPIVIYSYYNNAVHKISNEIIERTSFGGWFIVDNKLCVPYGKYEFTGYRQLTISTKNVKDDVVTCDMDDIIANRNFLKLKLNK